uniref:hypothetical protein n=1 Tax=Undibacterium sp. TaxID=1914977 RepID=UPI00375020AB
AWIGNKRPDFEGTEARMRGSVDGNSRGTRIEQASDRRLQLPANMVQLSEAALRAQTEEAQASQAVDKVQDDIDNDPRMMVIKYLIEQLTGRKIENLKTADLEGNDTSINLDMPTTAPTTAPTNSSASGQNARTIAGWGVEIDVHHSYTETEQTKFQSSGTITTADNRKIEFNLNFELSRSYHEESHTQIRQGDGKKIDPLTLNFSGNSAQLTSQKFSFDLNADGKKENISFVQGAGFLAFDKNGDGKINDGSELFGPGTGNGFAELAAYDSDGNHWIDENDAIFDKLQVWTKDGAGKDQLQKLKQANVGALFLGNVATPFELKSGKNHSDGQIKSSGLWLTEDGQAKSLQQVDLTV